MWFSLTLGRAEIMPLGFQYGSLSGVPSVDGLTLPDSLLHLSREFLSFSTSCRLIQGWQAFFFSAQRVFQPLCLQTSWSLEWFPFAPWEKLSSAIYWL